MKYKMANNAVFPPFNIFVDFVKEMIRVKNDPSFMYNGDMTHSQGKCEHQEDYSVPANRYMEFQGV